MLGKQLVSKIRKKYFPFLNARLGSAYLDEEHDKPLSPDWVMGAFMMVRREAVCQVGMLDEDYFMYDEDLDWCYRFKKAGWDIHYTPNSSIIHLGGVSSSVVPKKTLIRQVSSNLMFFRKHHGIMASRLFALTNTIGLIIEVIIRVLLLRFLVREERIALQQLLFKLFLMSKCAFSSVIPFANDALVNK
jgi:GT2 family glycosyltransferase